MYSPRTFRELILPRLKVLAARCKELGLHYSWGTDGNIWLVSDMVFREVGVPGYGESDYQASMTMSRIRQRYPNLVVWANASGDLIRRGTYDQVYQHCMEILTASGGRRYFHGCSNTVLPGTPPENVWAMMQARDDYAKVQKD
jgi:uroporphyrinogen-III decarboxylase